MANNTHRHRSYVVSRTAYAVILLSFLLMLIGAMSCKQKELDETNYKKINDSLMVEQWKIFSYSTTAFSGVVSLQCDLKLKEAEELIIKINDSSARWQNNVDEAFKENYKKWNEAIEHFYR